MLELQNQPASITITYPSEGAQFWMDEDISIYASTSDPDFGIERVDFYANEMLIEQDTTSPYRHYNWTPDTAGSYGLSARTVDRFGTETSSTSVQVTFIQDSDLDRMPDHWEHSQFWDGVSTEDLDGDGIPDQALEQEASGDFDGDGVPNIFEYKHGTDPCAAEHNILTGTLYDSDSAPFTGSGATIPYQHIVVDHNFVTESDLEKQTLSAAIVATDDFDVIEVRAGTYPEALGTVYDRLYVFSSDGARRTIVDTTGLETRTLNLQSESVFSELTFRGANLPSSSYNGGALYVSISGDQNKPRFIGCRFIQNTAAGAGGAIYVGYGHPLFVSCTIAGNRASDGNAIYNASSSNQITLVNTLLWNPGASAEITGNVSSVLFDHSLTRDDTSGNVLIDGVNQLTSQPGLAFDYSLSSTSVARDQGALGAYSEYATVLDCDDEAVTDGSRDIGADEFTDSDSDGLPDWIETAAGIDLVTGDDYDGDLLNNLEDYLSMGDPLDNDTDGDGLLDGDEAYSDGTHGDLDGYATALEHQDTDNDGISDSWELSYGFNPTDPADGAMDSDFDGLDNELEFLLGSNPLSSDTDGNGMSDELEYLYGMDLGTHLDTDSDGIPDDYENAFGLNPSDASDAVLDLDGDGLSNLLEYQAGTKADYFDSDGDRV